MTENILAETKPTTITLADGKEYILPPIDLTTLANIEKSLGFSLRVIREKFEAETAQVLQSLTYALLKENYPQLTKDEAGHLVTLDVLVKLNVTFAHIMAIAG